MKISKKIRLMALTVATISLSGCGSTLPFVEEEVLYDCAFGDCRADKSSKIGSQEIENKIGYTRRGVNKEKFSPEYSSDEMQELVQKKNARESVRADGRSTRFDGRRDKTKADPIKRQLRDGSIFYQQQSECVIETGNSKNTKYYFNPVTESVSAKNAVANVKLVKDSEAGLFAIHDSSINYKYIITPSCDVYLSGGIYGIAQYDNYNKVGDSSQFITTNKIPGVSYKYGGVDHTKRFNPVSKYIKSSITGSKTVVSPSAGVRSSAPSYIANKKLVAPARTIVTTPKGNIIKPAVTSGVRSSYPYNRNISTNKPYSYNSKVMPAKPYPYRGTTSLSSGKRYPYGASFNGGKMITTRGQNAMNNISAVNLGKKATLYTEDGEVFVGKTTIKSTGEFELVDYNKVR